MEPHLTPLRYGQQFQLCQEEIGISPYRDSKEQNYFNLRHFTPIDETPAEKYLCRISPDDSFVAENAYWALSLDGRIEGGWAVTAFRLSDRKEFGFLQRVDTSLWHREYPGHPEGQTSEMVTDVGNVQWPTPSPESLRWATEAIVNEQLSGSRRIIMPGLALNDLYSLPLGEGLALSLSLLKTKWHVPDPEAKLRERGFQV